MNRRKLLLIENQLTQFREIRKSLEDSEYDLFPDNELVFKTYHDWIRVWLNPRYAIESRNECWKRILEQTNEYNPEILIIDHVLVGTHDALDGIDLAIKLRENEINQPIIFFSRTEVNNIEICDKLPKVPLEKEWIFKGYSGAEILEKKLFKDKVIPTIERFLTKSLQNRIIAKLIEKKPSKITTATTDVQRAIIEQTEKLIVQLNSGIIPMHNAILTQISTSSSESAYLEFLKSLISS